jgi:hypothetical protein
MRRSNLTRVLIAMMRSAQEPKPLLKALSTLFIYIHQPLFSLHEETLAFFQHPFLSWLRD